MQLGCFGFHRQIYPQEGDSKKKWKIEIFGKFDMPNNMRAIVERTAVATFQPDLGGFILLSPLIKSLSFEQLHIYIYIYIYIYTYIYIYIYILWARLISRWIWILCSYNEFLLSF